MAKPNRPFNNPFSKVRLEKPAPARRPAPAPPPPKAAPPVEDDGSLFAAWVGEVEPVRAGKDRVLAEARPAAPARRRGEDEEAFAQLAELVAGTGPFDLADSDEYVEGAVAGLDRKILKRLRAGDYAVQAHVDLHGMTRTEARAATLAFIENARHRGHRCVLIVHGRGLHSKDQIPVLKESVQLWLTKGRIAREVLAFTTARPHDGGAGAAYVLLRR